MKIAEIWRYPVKSMGGERLEMARIDVDGVEGDRLVHVEDARGHLITARTHPQLLGMHATLGADGEPLVDGSPWNDPEILRKVTDIVGPGARLVRDKAAKLFDILPLLVATDGAIAAFGHDSRRLRPNIIVGGVEGLAERSWEGQLLKLPNAVIGIQDLRGRCVMTTYDPDTQEHDGNVLREIVQKFAGRLALNCYVRTPGVIRVGEEVELVERRTAA